MRATAEVRRLGQVCLLLTFAAVRPLEAQAATYYVRQSVGNDANDGLSAATAWKSISKLSAAMHAGDTAYVGPGLYREQVDLQNSGAADKRIVLIADSDGRHTGDPPGTVMITGAEPMDETIFEPGSAPGVYKAHFPAFKVSGGVEMDGDQSRYTRADITPEYHVQKLSEVDVVAKLPKSFHYDEAAQTLYVHTSDGKPPASHEIELMRRFAGISMFGKHYVTIVGFTFRHMQDGGISFFKGSGDGIAINNVSYGSRQGIRVYTATNIALYGNTLFRNENSGVYFAADSTGAIAIGNVAYENVKGIRWGSRSGGSVAVDNVLFDNLERGASVEETKGALLRRNRLVNNAAGQFQGFDSEFDSDNNCFENGNAKQIVANLSLFEWKDHYRTLAEYREHSHQELASREGGCGKMPDKIDVHRLHAETQAYAERARALLLSGAAPAKSGGSAEPSKGFGGWLRRLLGHHE